MLDADVVPLDHPLDSFSVDLQDSNSGLLVSFRVIEHSPDMLGFHLRHA
jgi:hypothetical protein